MSDPLDAITFGRSPRPVVLFDANILFQATASRFLLGGTRAGLYRAIWTDEIIEEARRNLAEAGRIGGLAALEQNLQFVRNALVDSASPRAVSVFLATHEDDRHVIAAAAKHSASVLVTDNVRDFSRAEATAAGIVVATARGLATHLARSHADAMVRFVEREPPERFERFVSALRRQFPEAVESLGL